jgi:hypothetical protein
MSILPVLAPELGAALRVEVARDSSNWADDSATLEEPHPETHRVNPI